MHGITLKVYLILKPVLTPNSQCLVTVLIREYIDNIRMFDLLCYLFRSFASLCGKQRQAADQKVDRFIHIHFSKSLLRINASKK